METKLSPHVVWGGVAIIIAMVAGMVTLGVVNADAGALVAVVTGVLSLLGNVVILMFQSSLSSKVEALRVQTNGHQTRLLDAAIGKAEPPAPPTSATSATLDTIPMRTYP